MTTLASQADRHPVDPPDQADRPEKERIRYFLRPPTVYDRAELRRAVAGRGARMPSDDDYFGALEAGLADLLPGVADAALRKRYLGLISTARTAPRERAYALVEDIADMVRAGDARFAQVEAAQDYWVTIQSLECARRFVVDWEGIGAPLSRGKDGLLDEAALAQIPELHLPFIANRAQELFAPTAAEGKGSASRSRSSSARKTSSSAGKGARRRSAKG